MSAQQQSAFEQQALQRIQQLIEKLESAPDPTVTAPARELLEVVLELHGQGLNRMMGIVADSKDALTLIERFTADEQVNALLLLHDLHPEDTATRVGEAVEHLRPHLAVQGVGISSFEFSDGVVRLKLESAAAGGNQKPPAAEALRAELEEAIFTAAPDVDGIEMEGVPVPTVAVPLSRVGKYRPGATANE